MTWHTFKHEFANLQIAQGRSTITTHAHAYLCFINHTQVSNQLPRFFVPHLHTTQQDSISDSAVCNCFTLTLVLELPHMEKILHPVVYVLSRVACMLYPFQYIDSPPLPGYQWSWRIGSTESLLYEGSFDKPCNQLPISFMLQVFIIPRWFWCIIHVRRIKLIFLNHQKFKITHMDLNLVLSDKFWFFFV